MSYGITDAGYVIKPFDTIVEEIEDSIKVKLGNDIVFVPEDPLKEIIDTMAEREYSLRLQQLDIYNSGYISKASGKNLDYACEMVNVTRDAAIKGYSLSQAFWGVEGSTIAAGTIVSTINNSDYGWETLTDVVIGAGADTVYSFDRSAVPTGGNFKLSLLGQTTSTLSYDATATDIENAINALFGVHEVTVDDGTTTWIDINFALQDVTITIADNTLIDNGTDITLTLVKMQEGEYQIITGVTALDTGIQTANAYAINSIIEQTGSNVTDTLNTTEAFSGSDIQEDSALRSKAINGYQIIKYTTLDGMASGLSDLDFIESVKLIQNDKNIYLFPGTENEIPPKSFKPYFFPYQTLTEAQEQETAQAVLDAKPIGIESVGAVSKIAYDSEGNPCTIGINYPVEVPIYVIIVLSTDSDFPVNGNQLVATTLVDWGNGLGSGEDVITHGSDSVCGQISTIDGIPSYTLKIGTASDPTLADNISIDDGLLAGTVEVSSWDLANISVTNINI